MSRRYPASPVVGVSGVVLAGESVLLVKRGAEPAKGLWSLPGGGLELGETLAQGVAREIAEETGLAVEVGPLVEVVERLRRDAADRVEYHYVLLDYLCRAEPTPPTAGDDAAQARWVPLDQVGDLGLTADTARVIAKAVALRDGFRP
ncbi:MAG: NUDIX hydrolase [Deltaproteobacteria bacterium]|nr:NUDIX hydrolase [Deltaproteobacteria bacterium]